MVLYTASGNKGISVFGGFFSVKEVKAGGACLTSYYPFISESFQWRVVVNQESGIEVQIADYFKQSASQRLTQEEVMRTLADNIARTKETFKEKAMVSGLLEKLETESDAVKLQVYRQALELLLRKDRF
ncbi:biofilm development regulator YmgB/AriR family protein [Mixta gaviniae]|uniref:Uncharacterized protein n=1 Tax=Mixta gaviniae TaxID=665914 RepID=A0A2L0IF57_9GAMM|nr:biofilm development regulator YmgB/AriR family protein [Mixta gaviniae]AUX93174.1 hypothetical protein C2E15_08850 [Mixta gaviniae]